MPSNRPILAEYTAQRVGNLAQRRESCQGFLHRIEEVGRAFRGAFQVGQGVLDGRVVPGLPELLQAFGLAIADGLIDRVKLHIGVVGAFSGIAVHADYYPLSPLHLPLVAVRGVLDLALHKALLDGLYGAPQLRCA